MQVAGQRAAGTAVGVDEDAESLPPHRLHVGLGDRQARVDACGRARTPNARSDLQIL
jgi:hypothetical protein